MLVSISAKVDMATNTLAFYPATSDLFSMSHAVSVF